MRQRTCYGTIRSFAAAGAGSYLPVIIPSGWTCKLYATSADPQKPDLKRQLRELYKRVHPDRFHAHPFARDANEKSFKLLQEYLSESKEGGSFGAIAGVPYRFVFYLRQRPEAPSQQAAAILTEEEGLFKVGVTLPPPGRLHQFPGSNVMNPSAHKAIGSLLRACGLDTGVEDEDVYHYSQGGTPGSQSFSASRLRDFVPRAALILQQSETNQFGPLEHLRLAQTALRMGRQIKVEFLDKAQWLPTGEKAALLQSLAACLDKLPEEVCELTLLLGNGYGIDSLGRVRLDYGDNPNLWAGFLLQLDMEACRDRQATVSRIRNLERSAAASLGLPLVCARSHLTLTPAYCSFLLDLIGHGQQQQPVFSPVPQGLTLLVKGEQNPIASATPSEEEMRTACEISDEDSLITVPVNASSRTVFAFCKEHGSRLIASREQRQRETADLDLLRHKTERRMRLRKLTLDHTVSPAHLKECCLRLTQASDSLKNLLDGLTVRISHTNQVVPNVDCIDIAWNFKV